MRIALLFVLAAAATALASCATVSQAQNQCAAFGYTAGTPEYTECVQQQYQANQDSFQQRLLNASRIANEGTPSDDGSAIRGSAFLKRSYVSGMNRVCVYNNMGSDYVQTIGAADICPLHIP